MPQLLEERRAVTPDEPHDQGPLPHLRHNPRFLPVLRQRLRPLVNPAHASLSEPHAHNNIGFGITYDNGIPSIHTCLYMFTPYMDLKMGTRRTRVQQLSIYLASSIRNFIFTNSASQSFFKGIGCWGLG